MTDLRRPEIAGAPSGRDIAGHSAVYMLGSVVAVIGGVAMVPIYTHALPTSDYGLLDTVLRFVAMCMSVAFLGIRQGYQRLYFDAQSINAGRRLTATALVANFVIASFSLLPLLAFAALAGRHFELMQLTPGRAAALALWIGLEATYLIGLSHLQVRMKSRQFVLVQSARLLLLMGINIVLLNVAHLGLDGALIANFMSSVLSGLVAALALLRLSGPRISGDVFKSLVTFGVPYIPTVAFVYVIGNSDRLALVHYGAVDSNGLLALAGKVGELALMLLVAPVDNVWSPYSLSVFAQADGPERIGALYVKFVALCVFMALGVSLAAPVAVTLLARPEYAFAARLVPIVALGWVFNVLATLSDIGILISKKTWMKPLITGAVAVIAVALQWALTPRFGVVGAASATSLAYLALFLVTRVLGQRAYKMIARSRDLAIIALAGAVPLLLGISAMSVMQPTWWISPIVSILGVSAYGLVLILTRVITVDDLKVLAARVPSRAGSMA